MSDDATLAANAARIDLVGQPLLARLSLTTSAERVALLGEWSALFRLLSSEAELSSIGVKGKGVRKLWRASYSPSMRTLTAPGSGMGSRTRVLGNATDSGKAWVAAGGGGGSAAAATALVNQSASIARAVTPGRLSERKLFIARLLGAHHRDARR